MSVDPVGCDTNEMDEKKDRILDIVRECFGEYHRVRFPSRAHFPTAFLWVWNSANKREGEYLFHLEEDWRLDIPIDFNNMVNIMEEDKSVIHLRLSKAPSTELTCKNWSQFLDWNGKYFEVKKEERGHIGFAGHPSLNRKNFTIDAVDNVGVSINPEKQMKWRWPWFKKWMGCRFGSFHPQNTPPAIVDIGRHWMVEHGWAKKGNKAWFTEWEQI